jgi:hypothetical protein
MMDSQMWRDGYAEGFAGAFLRGFAVTFGEDLGDAGLRARRECIVRVLHIRFGVANPEPFADHLDELDRVDQLEPLVAVATTCASLAEFAKALAGR